MEKIIRSVLIAALLICPMQLLAQREPTPMEKVRVLAGEHAITTGKRHGVYWVEVEGSDIFGTGETLDEAAIDFLADADLEGHETNRPNLKPLPQVTKPQIDCAEAYCL
jgi:hypothetical protein